MLRIAVYLLLLIIGVNLNIRTCSKYIRLKLYYGLY